MDPVSAGLIVGAPLLSGMIGGLTSASDRQKALELNQEALQQWLSVSVPDPNQQKLILQRYVQTGQMSPELESAVKQADSHLNGVQADPGAKAATLKALGALEDLGYSGGMTLEDKSNLQAAENKIAQDAKSRRATIVDNMRRRGTSGSGLDLQAQLSGAQGDTNTLSNAQLQTLSDARKRAFDSIINAGDLGMKMNAQDFEQQAAKARAQDAIDQFNSATLQGVRTRNINRVNDAKAANLAEQQRVADQNVGLTNNETQWNNVGRWQQYFDNQSKLASGKANALTGNANAYVNNANQNANMWANIGKGTAKAGAVLANGSNSSSDESDPYAYLSSPKKVASSDEEEAYPWEVA